MTSMMRYDPVLMFNNSFEALQTKLPIKYSPQTYSVHCLLRVLNVTLHAIRCMPHNQSPTSNTSTSQLLSPEM